MKKLLLASIMGVMAIAGAHAAPGYDGEHWKVRMDGNPLYRPTQGYFYSITDLRTDTDFDYYTLGEEFGFGITDRLSVLLNTAGSLDTNYEQDPIETAARDKTNWDDFGLGMNFRYVDHRMWIADLYGKVRQDYAKDVNVVDYNWTVGTTVGFVGWYEWTLALTLQADNIKDSLAGADFNAWGGKVGIDALYNLDENWNVIGGLYGMFDMSGNSEYPGYHDDPMVAKLGFNYNFNDWTYLGVYVDKDLREDFDVAPMGLGAKFGVEF